MRVKELISKSAKFALFGELKLYSSRCYNSKSLFYTLILYIPLSEGK